MKKNNGFIPAAMALALTGAGLATATEAEAQTQRRPAAQDAGAYRCTVTDEGLHIQNAHVTNKGSREFNVECGNTIYQMTMEQPLASGFYKSISIDFQAQGGGSGPYNFNSPAFRQPPKPAMSACERYRQSHSINVSGSGASVSIGNMTFTQNGCR